MHDNFEFTDDARVVNTGEVYVICSECGARVWSRDAHPNETQDVSIPCPYKRHRRDLAEQYGCL